MGDDRRERFELLYRSCGAEVLAYALRRSNHEMANDVCAETFVVAWRRLETVPDDPLPWLLGVARRKLSNARRSDGRFEALQIRLLQEPQRVGQGDALPVGAELVLAELRRLPERYREALLLVAWEGLTDTQAAQVLGCTPTAFRLRLHRARKRLVRRLQTDQRCESVLTKPQETG